MRPLLRGRCRPGPPPLPSPEGRGEVLPNLRDCGLLEQPEAVGIAHPPFEAPASGKDQRMVQCHQPPLRRKPVGLGLGDLVAHLDVEEAPVARIR